MDQSFESIPSSFAPAVVGILAQHVYGYKPIPQDASNSVEIETDRENAAPLAKAIYAAMSIPMAICCIIYSFLYCSYPNDRVQATTDALKESEMQKLVADSIEKCCHVHVLEVEMNAKEEKGDTIDREHEGEQKSLLSH